MLSAVAHRDVEKSVGAELKLATLVIRKRLVDGEQHALGGGIDDIAFRIDMKLGDDRLHLFVRRIGGEVDVEIAVGRKLRMKRDAQQPFLAAEVDLLADVEIWLGRNLAVANDLDPARLLDDELAISAIACKINRRIRVRRYTSPDEPSAESVQRQINRSRSKQPDRQKPSCDSLVGKHRVQIVPKS